MHDTVATFLQGRAADGRTPDDQSGPTDHDGREEPGRVRRKPEDVQRARPIGRCLVRGLSMAIRRHLGANSIWRVARR